MEMSLDYHTSVEDANSANLDSSKPVTSFLLCSVIAMAPPGTAIAAQEGVLPTEILAAEVTNYSDHFEADVESDSEASAAATVKQVREGFGLNVTELAEIFDVSRPTVYKWLKGGGVNREVYGKAQVLSVVAKHWSDLVGDQDYQFLLDYKGLGANAVSIREALKAETLEPESLKALIDARFGEYREASAASREIIGEPDAVTGDPIPAGTRKLNQLWTENANRLKSLEK